MERKNVNSETVEVNSEAAIVDRGAWKERVSTMTQLK